MNQTTNIKELIAARYPGAEITEESEMLKIQVSPGIVHDLLQLLKENPGAGNAHLSCLTCVDWNDQLEMVYIVSYNITDDTLIVKAKIEDVEKPVIESVSDLWAGANYHEREVFDMFGIEFTSHPNQTRIFLDEDWNGHPLRKNYQDDVNMVEM